MCDKCDRKPCAQGHEANDARDDCQACVTVRLSDVMKGIVIKEAIDPGSPGSKVARTIVEMTFEMFRSQGMTVPEWPTPESLAKEIEDAKRFKAMPEPESFLRQILERDGPEVAQEALEFMLLRYGRGRDNMIKMATREMGEEFAQGQAKRWPDEAAVNRIRDGFIAAGQKMGLRVPQQYAPKVEEEKADFSTEEEFLRALGIKPDEKKAA